MKTLSKLPLFERAKRQKVERLVVRHFEDGRWVRAPQTFRADELPDREAVREKFGGGRYDLIGRDAKHIIGRTTFVIDGPPLPLDEAVVSRDDRGVARNAKDLRAFATPGGEREALVFGFLNQGLDLVAITERTRIEARIVRSIYLEWITPFGWPLPTTPEQIADYARLRHAQMMAETERDWTRTWS